MKNEELKKLQEATAASLEKLKTFAEMDNHPSDEKMEKMRKEMMEAVYSSMSYMNERMNYLANDTYGHISAANIHLPKLTAGQMEKLLKMCGASEDYKIERPTISLASTDTKHGKILEVDWQSSDKKV